MKMETGTKESRLKFLQRMIWWMPVLAFAVVAAAIIAVGGTATHFVDGLVWGVIAAVIVGVVTFAVYYGYKQFLGRAA